MPQLHLETTADLPENADVPDILEALTTLLCSFDSVDSSKVKAYHSLRSVWIMGEGAPNGFAQLTVSVLQGRDSIWRAKVSESLLTCLVEQFQMSLENMEVSISVEIREMLADGYHRQA